MDNTSFSPEFVGRGPELAALAEMLSDADGGRPQAILVGGEAGVGKTRLVEEFIVRARAAGAMVAVGFCVEAGADALPFAPFSMVLRSLQRQHPEALAAAAHGQEDELARILPELGRPAERAYGEDGTARLFELTARLLERVAAERTVVLVVEDLHRADASTRHLLEYLVRVPSGGRLMAIGTYRSDDLPRSHPLRPLLGELDRIRSVRHFELPRFDRAEVVRQLAGILSVPPEPGLVEEIFARSDGNAFFVEELASSVGSGSRLSDSLRGLLLVRVEALPDDARRVVRAAAVEAAVNTRCWRPSRGCRRTT